jgi:UDP-N-acetylmuramate--alanine ligase
VKYKTGKQRFMRIYFIGIAGAGMHSLALYLSECGHDVWGSDPGATQDVCEFWAQRGSRIYQTQTAENIEGADLVVYSAAVPATNPERMAAAERGIACSRGEALARFANAHACSIAVCGTHGKGTTSAAITAMIEAAGMPVSDILGAVPIGRTQPTQYISDAQYLVCEVDESDKTNTCHRPGILVINNIEEDHLNVYRDLDDIVTTFETHVRQCLAHGSRVIIHHAGIGAPLLYQKLADCDGIYWISTQMPLDDADLRCTIRQPNPQGQCRLTLCEPDGTLTQIVPTLGGCANAQNIATAFAVGRALGIPAFKLTQALTDYKGLNHRCQMQEIHGIWFVPDYASHPTCVSNDIAWIRARVQRIHVVYHPYRYSLMQCHWDALGQALSDADHVYLLPFDPCGETHIDGIDSPSLAQNIENNGGHAQAFESFESTFEAVRQNLQIGDALMIFAGHKAFELGHEVCQKLKDK